MAEAVKALALGLSLSFFIYYYRRSSHENEYLCEFLWHVRGGLPVL